MIIPSIDLMDGQSVQLIQGKADSRDKEREYGDPVPLAEKFSLAGDIAVIDLDRALGKGENKETIKKLARMTPCRVGGGIRSVADAKEMLEAGALSVILGTAAKPEILRELPSSRVIAALDAFHGEVVVEGWTKKTGVNVLDRIAELKDLAGGIMVTFVEREGGLGGTDMELAAEIVKAAGKAKVTIAGGITTPEEIAELDKLGADAQVGMAIYTGQMDLADAICAPLVSDRPDGLFPVIPVEEGGGAMGLAYCNKESIREAIKRRLAVYHSRRRGIWVKGLTSGDYQELLRISLDCDRDAIRYLVRQKGKGFCHLDQRTCFGHDEGLIKLENTLAKRLEDAPDGSYSKKLMDDPELLKSKLLEEANELAEAESKEDVLWEAADLIYFAMTKMAKAGVTIGDLGRELDFRARKNLRNQ